MTHITMVSMMMVGYYNVIEDQARKIKPKMIVAGASAYSRLIDWSKFKVIADEVGAILLCDMAHYSGLIAGGHYTNPVHYADVVTSTTHKTLRGPRGGIILWNNDEYTKKLNSAIFPGTQGGPLMNMVASKAQAFKEANTTDFIQYIKQVIDNAQVMSDKQLVFHHIHMEQQVYSLQQELHQACQCLWVQQH